MKGQPFPDARAAARIIECLDGFYTALSKLSKPKIKGKALRDKKKRSGQEAYLREQLGDGFIDNPPLISAAKSAALALADDDAGEDEIVAKTLELASEHPCDDPLTDDQMKTLNKVISDQIAKHLKLDRIEAKILDEGNKNLYFMYGKIKCKAAVGDTIELGMKSAGELCKCSRSDVKPILNKLEKLGFIYSVKYYFLRRKQSDYLVAIRSGIPMFFALTTISLFTFAGLTNLYVSLFLWFYHWRYWVLGGLILSLIALILFLGEKAEAREEF
mgnify:CR=1 FL=1